MRKFSEFEIMVDDILWANENLVTVLKGNINTTEEEQKVFNEYREISKNEVDNYSNDNESVVVVFIEGIDKYVLCKTLKNIHRYLSTQRPISLGTYPKNDNILDIVNFNEKKNCNDINAWGYIDYSKPLSIEDIEEYELLKDITELKQAYQKAVDNNTENEVYLVTDLDSIINEKNNDIDMFNNYKKMINEYRKENNIKKYFIENVVISEIVFSSLDLEECINEYFELLKKL